MSAAELRDAFFNPYERGDEELIGIPQLYPLYRERRKYPRVPTHNLMREIVGNPSLDYRTRNLIDISEGGFQFTSSEWVSPRKIVPVVINLAEVNVQIPALVKVVWTRLIRKQKVFCRAGVTFLKIEPKYRLAIREYVNKISQKQDFRELPPAKAAA